MTAPRPLDGFRVLDFGRYVAGPLCAAMLGDLGADVIRVDRVGGSEDRHLMPLGGEGNGAMFLEVNRNKRGITLDPTCEAGAEVLRRLLATVDVVVANLPDGARRRMGIGATSLEAIDPRIVLTTVSAFGDAGPWAERPGFDAVGQVMSGAAHLSGRPGAPVKSYVQWVDFSSAALAAFGTVAALWDRERTGRGGTVEGTLLGTALAVAAPVLAEQAVLECDRIPTGNRAQVAAPADVFATRDGWIVVQVVGNAQFRRWAALVGAAEWSEDPRFGDDAGRGEHADLLCGRMAEWCSARITAEALDGLAEAGIPAGPVLSPRQALTHPQVAALDLFEGTTITGAGEVPVAALPLSFDGSIPRPRRRPPTIGEHTEEVLTEVGYSPAEVAELRRRGVV